MANTSSKSSESSTQVACIDLPGEAVQCWGGNVTKLKIILRKHRDVVFDIKIFKGAQYTIVAKRGELYDTRCKKIVTVGTPVYFRDGERLHLWIARSFQGDIELSANGKILGNYDPKKIDCPIESSDPLLKPSPLFVVMYNELPGLSTKTWSVIQADGTFKQSLTNEYQGTDGLLDIVEIPVSGNDIPREIANFFKEGGEKEVLPSDGVATRNWIFNAVVAQLGYVNDNKVWIKDLWGEKFRLVTVDHGTGGRKMYVILSGLTRRRVDITAARYGVANAKVLAFSFGGGSAAGLRHAAWGGVKGSFRNAGMLAILFTVTIDIAEWMKDYEQFDPKTGNRRKDVADLFIKVGVDIAKNVLVSLLSTVAMAALIAGGVASIGFIVVGTVVVSISIAALVDWVDKKSGASDHVSGKLKKIVEELGHKMPADYGGYDNSIQQALAYGGMGA
jgi:hypothetical protein